MAQMETMRSLMVAVASGKKVLHNGEVLSISQKLDQLILKVQAEKLRAAKKQVSV